MSALLAAARGVEKSFPAQPAEVRALRGVSLEIEGGEFLSIVGPSGSGKTTLLNLLGALDLPSAGSVELFGRDLCLLSGRERADLRLHAIGFVFQAYNLMPVLTALENVEFVLELQGVDRGRRERARAVLDELGLGDLADRRPHELSGGQQQRVAVARAVAARPRLVLADEPTANLDRANGAALLRMMRRLRDDQGMTFVFSTHDPQVIEHASRVVTLEDGLIAADERREARLPVGLIADLCARPPACGALRRAA